MAYIIGLLSPEEKTELARRGWEIEKPPAELVDDEVEELARKENGGGLWMIWVDAAMFDVMNGPGWEGAPE